MRHRDRESEKKEPEIEHTHTKKEQFKSAPWNDEDYYWSGHVRFLTILAYLTFGPSVDDLLRVWVWVCAAAGVFVELLRNWRVCCAHTEIQRIKIWFER